MSSDDEQDAFSGEINREASAILPQETLDAFDGDEIRARVFYEKYALKDAAGNALEKTPMEMW
ncbi:MAG: hypothetical protein QW091_01490, partial [Candidatus Micrarchaeaceae archaeon]